LISPKKGEVFAFDPSLPPSFQKIRAVVRPAPDLEELVFHLNGRKIARRKVSGPNPTSVTIALEKGPQNLAVTGLRQGRPVSLEETSFLVK
jgi:hypothetical protein